MSFVGTRPEVVKYVKKYKPEYLATLLLPAGITSEASIRYKDEAELQLYKKKGACCYLLKENLAKYRIRKKSISHDKLSKKLKSHYDLFHMCDEKMAPVLLHTLMQVESP